jgi:hypothetical protein
MINLSRSRNLIARLKGYVRHLLSYSLIKKDQQLLSRGDHGKPRHKLDRSHRILSNAEIDELMSCFGDQGQRSSNTNVED